MTDHAPERNLDDGDTLVTQAEIARRYGVTRSAVGQWFRASDAPRAIPQSPFVRLWWWDTIRDWRAATADGTRFTGAASD